MATSAGNNTTRTLKLRAGRALLWVINTATDPVVATSLVAPFIIITALKLARADLQGLGTQESLLNFFNTPQFPGVVDYVVQIYSAVLSYAIFLVRGFVDVAFPLAERFKHMNEEDYIEHNIKYLAFVVYAMIVFAIGLWLFFLGGACDVNVVKSYAERQFELGDFVLPVANRILLLRGLIGIGGFWLIGLRSARTSEHATTRA